MRRFLVLLLVISVAIIPFGATFADQSASRIVSEEPSVRRQVCDVCGGNVQLFYTVPTDWAQTDSRDCTHGYDYGKDIEETRMVTYVYKCIDCGNTTTVKELEHRWICEGYN